MEAAFTELQQQMQAVQVALQNLSLGQNIQILQQQVQALAAQPQPAPVAAAAAAVPILKPAKPDTLSSVRSSGRPEAWLFTIDTYFEATGISDPHRVTFVATLLRGAAALWWQSHRRSVTEQLLASPPGLTSGHPFWSSLRL